MNDVAIFRTLDYVLLYLQRVPYRLLYPNASAKEWKTKKDGERSLHVLQLRNPNMDLNELWPAGDEDEHESTEGTWSETREVIEVPILTQIYQMIKESKEIGVSELEFGRAFALGRLSRRAMLKKIKKLANVEFYVSSEGRQKTRRYVVIYPL